MQLGRQMHRRRRAQSSFCGIRAFVASHIELNSSVSTGVDQWSKIGGIFPPSPADRYSFVCWQHANCLQNRQRWASVSAPTLIVDVEIDDHLIFFILSAAKNDHGYFPKLFACNHTSPKIECDPNDAGINLSTKSK